MNTPFSFYIRHLVFYIYAGPGMENRLPGCVKVRIGPEESLVTPSCLPSLTNSFVV